MLNLLIVLIALGSTYIFLRKRVLRYLQFMQQDDYSNSRFFNWLKTNKAFDTKASVVGFSVFILSYLASPNIIILFPLTILTAVSLLILNDLEPDPVEEGKCPLVLTPRAKRIYITTLILLVLFTAFFLYIITKNVSSSCLIPYIWLLSAFLVQSVPFSLMLGVYILEPSEKKIRKSYVKEAKNILETVNPFIIGVTGSYGKTSVKSILGHILKNTLAPTFWPKKGTNTLMGITRCIREEMGKSDEFSVIEMGAYQEGSIEKLCNFTPPKAAIITAIDNMHLERFKTRESIYSAKTELIRALPKDSILVLNGDNEGTRKAYNEYKDRNPVLYGFDNSREDLDCFISEYNIAEDGTYFTLNWRGEEYKGKTKMLGEAVLSNIMASFSMAALLGCDKEFILSTIQTILPVDNRLFLEKSNGVTWLKDAYNSNPVGFKCALDVLAKIGDGREKKGKKILITPGMIELGEEQFSLNKNLAKHSSKVCDLVIVVGETNRDSLVSGLKEGGLEESKIVVVKNREDGFLELQKVVKAGDVILIENDLTDLHETEVLF